MGIMKNFWRKSNKNSGFTIVELLIVIVVIAILAVVAIVAYRGVQDRAKNVQVKNDIRQMSKLIEAYNADKGSYPSTGGLDRVYTDSNCLLSVDSDGYKGTDWVPGVSGYSKLPQNQGLTGAGRGAIGGCYVYASDGVSYIVSAWNAKRGGPSVGDMYRRLGWRENGFFSANSYFCNQVNVGGGSTGAYSANKDYYKHSYTISNITDCDETPPGGA